MLTKDFVISCPTGLHARPAAILAQEAGAFSASIVFRCDGRETNIKSILSVMALGLKAGKQITVVVDGQDEASAMARLETFFTQELQSL